MAVNEVTDRPKVSIIIPVYNGSDFLAEAIDSALAQTYRSIEIVVVNDGSSDEGATERIARSYGERIRYFSKPNGGVASALNLAISEMSGDYFSWLSHDDLYTSDKIERELELLASVPAADRAHSIVFSDYAVFTSDPSQAIPVVMRGVEPECFRYWITLENCLHGCTLLIPRTAFEDVGVFDERLRTTQDYDLWFRLAARYRFIHINRHLVLARSHAQQGTRSMPTTVQTEGNALMSKFAAELSEAELLHASRQELIVAYAKIASSLWYRGYTSAGWQVTKRALDCLQVASLLGVVKAFNLIVVGIAGYYVMKPLRRRIPAGLRSYLRRSLFRSRLSTVFSPNSDLRCCIRDVEQK